MEVNLLRVWDAQVVEAAVIGIPHPKWSERPLLIAVPNPKQPPSKDELLSFLKVRKAPTEQPTCKGRGHARLQGVYGGQRTTHLAFPSLFPVFPVDVTPSQRYAMGGLLHVHW